MDIGKGQTGGKVSHRFIVSQTDREISRRQGEVRQARRGSHRKVAGRTGR